MSPRQQFLAGLLFTVSACTAYSQGLENVLIRSAKPYSGLVQAIEAKGGRVTHQYRYAGGIAAQIPREARSAITALVGASAVSKDRVINAPAPVEARIARPDLTRTGDEGSIVFDSAQGSAGHVDALAAASPSVYLLNNIISNARALHASGITGAGVAVAVIDSGIRPGFPHLSLDGSVIGCGDFVDDALGCSNFANAGHGTFVAGMISANVNFTFSTASALRNAVLAECPACFANPPVNTQSCWPFTAPKRRRSEKAITLILPSRQEGRWWSTIPSVASCESP